MKSNLATLVLGGLLAGLLAACTTPSAVRNLADKTAANVGTISAHLRQLGQNGEEIATLRADNISRLHAINTEMQARYEYDILETVEAGLVLTGTEIKSIRDGRVNIRDAYARRMNGEMWLFNTHVAQYPSAGLNNHEPDRPRKLLLKKDQIEDLAEQVEARGLTLVPLRLYIRNHRAKVELGVGRGRTKYDKRQVIAKRDADRRIREATRHRL